MEQKKTLWIIAAVGIFLLVVIGFAMPYFVNYSQRLPAIAKAGVTKQAPASNNGWQSQPELPPTNAPVPPAQSSSANVQDMFVVSENTTVLGFDQPAQNNSQGTTIDLNALKRELTADLQTSLENQPAVTSAQPQNINITVNIPESEKQLTVQTPVMVASDYYIQNTPEPAVDTGAGSTPSPAPKSTQTAKNTSKPAPVVSTKTVVNSTTTITKAVTRYWVQVAAYSNKKTAENARSVLTDKKITSDIYTYQDAKDKLFYRVRVGPFTTKSEAEYWKAKIVEINDFAKAGSYVTSTVD